MGKKKTRQQVTSAKKREKTASHAVIPLMPSPSAVLAAPPECDRLAPLPFATLPPTLLLALTTLTLDTTTAFFGTTSFCATENIPSVGQTIYIYNVPKGEITPPPSHPPSFSPHRARSTSHQREGPPVGCPGSAGGSRWQGGQSRGRCRYNTGTGEGGTGEGITSSLMTTTCHCCHCFKCYHCYYYHHCYYQCYLKLHSSHSSDSPLHSVPRHSVHTSSRFQSISWVQELFQGEI